MKQLLFAAMLVVGFIATSTMAEVRTVAQAPAIAQDEATPVPVTVEVGHVYPVELPADEPLVLWAGETIVNPNGQFAKSTVLVQTANGEWLKLTPCDDVIVTCETFAMRIEGVTQGEQFYLDLGGE